MTRTEYFLTCALVLSIGIGAWLYDAKQPDQPGQKFVAYDRQFVIYYHFVNGPGWGHGNISVESAGFPSENKIMREIEKINHLKKGDAVITGIMELTKQDFKNWNK